tara:strand:+ start:139 stop:675 length:537 start_codon:yes stop_codon:yes gene_type:complete
MCAGGPPESNPNVAGYRDDPHYTSGTSQLSYQEAYGDARPEPTALGSGGYRHDFARPGDPGWTGELPHPYSWMEDFKDETNREQYYSEYWRPSEMAQPGAFAFKGETQDWSEDNPPDWHYNKDHIYYDWLPDDMQRGQGSPWQIAEDARNRERLRIKNEVTLSGNQTPNRPVGTVNLT